MAGGGEPTGHLPHDLLCATDTRGIKLNCVEDAHQSIYQPWTAVDGRMV
jgi:hypothetical protein